MLPGWQSASPPPPGDGQAPARGPEPVAQGSAPAGTFRAALALGALLGALLVVIAQFTALYHLHSAASSVPIKTIGTGANHAWAPMPLALLAVVLAYAVYRYGSRVALVGLAALGIATLLITLLGDLSDAHSSGLIGSSAGGYVQATSSASAGLYMETLGSVLLLIAGGLGLLMLAPSRPGWPQRPSLQRPGWPQRPTWPQRTAWPQRPAPGPPRSRPAEANPRPSIADSAENGFGSADKRA